jgi:hypothetical protein
MHLDCKQKQLKLHLPLLQSLVIHSDFFTSVTSFVQKHVQMNTCIGASLPKPIQNLCIVTTESDLKYQITQLRPCTWDTNLHNPWLIATLRPRQCDFKVWSCNIPKQVQLTVLCFSDHKHYYIKCSTLHVWFGTLRMLHVWCRHYTAHTIQPVDKDVSGLWSNNSKAKMVWHYL